VHDIIVLSILEFTVQIRYSCWLFCSIHTRKANVSFTRWRSVIGTACSEFRSRRVHGVMLETNDVKSLAAVIAECEAISIGAYTCFNSVNAVGVRETAVNMCHSA